MALKRAKKSASASRGLNPATKERVMKRFGLDGVTEEPVIDYLDHAPTSPIFTYTDGLFQSVPRGKCDTPLDVTAARTKAPTFIRFQAPCQLGVEEQSVFYYLCQLATQSGSVLDEKNEKAKEYADSLGISGYETMPPIVGYRIRVTEIVTGLGLNPTGPNTSAIKARLDRLAQVTMSRFNGVNGDGPFTPRTRLIGVSPRDDGTLAVLLNPEASACITDKHGVVWVNMREQRLLASKPSRRLHAWFCAWASTQAIRKVTLKKLIKHIWGQQQCSRPVHNSRMVILRKVIREISSLPGWVCVLDSAGGNLYVRKPLFVGMTMESVVSRIANVASTVNGVASLSVAS
jgi:hypothetical protein